MSSMLLARAGKPPHWPNLVIRASAGTGKTYQLSNRYLSLLAAGVGGEQILATTFTRKAAGEILDRILFRLARAATDSHALAELAKAIDPSLSRDRCLELLEAVTRQLHRLRVGTLDSFFISIAGNFSLELGLPFGWTIADEATDARLRARAVEATLSQDATDDLLTLLHSLSKGDSDRSITRIVHETVDRLYEIYRDAPASAWEKLPYFNGLSDAEFADVVRKIRAFPLEGGLEKGRNEDLERVAAHDWEAFVAKGLGGKIQQGQSTYFKREIPPALVALYGKLLTHARSVLINPVVNHNLGTLQLLTKFDREYQRLKRADRALRFDDVTRLVARSLEVESERLGFRLDGGIQHLLLDEFQDTSLAQWEVLRRFAREVTSATDGSSFFCVGDVKQAIYGWRGGLAEIFNALDDELTSLQRSELVKSYRSTQPVIDTVNTIFQKLHTHPNLGDHEDVVRQWQTRFSPHTTAKTDEPGYACLRVLPVFDDADDADAERDDFIAQYIIDQTHAAPGVEIGVLVRSNRLVRRLIFALRAKGVEASEEGGNPLVDSAAVNLILSLLRIADHPGDTVSRFHVARSPLGAALGFTNLADEEAAARLSANTRRELIDEGYGPVVLRWAKLLAPSCNRREMSRLDQLVELAYRYDPNGSIRADHFIAMVEEAKVSDPTSAPVRVMTVHQAKGLEFGIVILPELDTKLVGENAAFVTGRPSPTEHATAVCRYVEKAYWPFLPDEFQKMFRDENDQRVSEALCVLYVELTRPVHALHMLIDADSACSTTVHRTPAGFLKSSLCEGQPLAADSIAYESGDADWYLQLVSPPAPRALPAPAQRFEIHLAADGASRERGWQSVSPSQLEGGPTLRIAEVFRPARSGGQEFGTLMHAWLSRIEWLEQGLPKDELLERIAVEEVGWGRDTSAERKQFYQYLERQEIKDILTQKSFKKDPLCKCDELMVENERRFALRQNGQLVNGSIDRIVLYLKAGQVIAADVLDYKTDALPPGDADKLAEKVEFYRPQLAAYVGSVQQMYGLSAAQCRSRLVFLATGDIVTLEDRATHEVPARRRHPHRQPTQRMLF